MSSVQNFEKPLFISCTPLNDNDNRYMKWNAHGIIRHFNNDDTNQINVQFHDTSIHSSIEFPNDKEYSYADLTSNAVLFASSKVIHCVHFDKQFEENEWSIHLNKGEQIKAVCLGEQFIAVATNNRHLRFYSLNGTQHHLISIPGPVQCLVASNKTLVAIYHRQLPTPDSQSLDAMIIEVDLETNSVCNLEFSPVRLPLSYRSNLRWIGFTDEGTLGLLDSSGSLKLFKSGLGLNWVEVANLFQQVDENVENVFIISVSDLQQEIRCVLCYKSRYPSPESIPVMQQLKFNLELCKTTSELNELEEKNILCNVRCSMLNSLADRNIDTSLQIKDTLKQQVDSLFKIFQDANQNNNETRQLDSAKLIPSLKTIESLIKYAEQSRLVSLVPKLTELMENKRNDQNQELISPYTALPSKQSILQRSETHCSADLLTPLIIEKSTFEQPESNFEDRVLDDIEPNRFADDVDPAMNGGEDGAAMLDEDGARIIDEDDELLRVVTTDEITKDIKNPFRV